MKHLLEVFCVIADHGRKLKVSKCSFAKSKLRLFGHIVDKIGVHVDTWKIDVILRTVNTSNTTDLGSFLDPAGYYSPLIPRFAEESARLNAATSSKEPLAWTEETQKVFESLKLNLSTPPVLAFHYFDEPFLVEADASSVAVGAVLAQKKEDSKTHPIQHASRTMSQAGRRNSGCEREDVTVVFALKKFPLFLLSSDTFTLVAIRQALQYDFKKKDIHGRLARWLDLLVEYDFKVTYCPGVRNGAADFLSHITQESDDRMNSADERELVDRVRGPGSLPLNGFSGFEPALIAITKYLSEFEAGEEDPKFRRRTRRNTKGVLSRIGKLLRRKGGGLGAIPPAIMPSDILQAFLDEIGH